MRKEYILVIDSGVGGLSTLASIYKKNMASFIYFADTKNAPYGNYNKQQIHYYLKSIIKNIAQKYKIIMVILACNTATTACINELRKEFDYIFVGTEPAINLAYKNGFKNILALTTPATKKQYKYRKLQKLVPAKINTFAMQNFAKNIENYIINKSIKNYIFLQKNLTMILCESKKFDSIVLGCTHYVFAKNKIQLLTEKPVFDGNDSVAKVVCKNLQNLQYKKTSKNSIIFLNSDDNKIYREKYKKIFKQILANL